MDQDGHGVGDAEGVGEVGSVGEEAAKLLGALSDWARDHGIEEHLATGAAECTWCPVCRTVHVLRRTSPEVRAHLATAAGSLMQAAAAILAAAAREPQDRGPGVQHIDLDDDGEWEPDVEDDGPDDGGGAVAPEEGER